MLLEWMVFAALAAAPAPPRVDAGLVVQRTAAYGVVEGGWELFIVTRAHVIRIAPRRGDTRTGWRSASEWDVTRVSGPDAALTLPAGPVHPAALGLPREPATGGKVWVERVDARTLRFAARGLRFGKGFPLDVGERSVVVAPYPP
ncbi:MAG: hypothetical protein RL653_584 [Pseudomonadota bacterium]|jgi:hypothetical protein